MFLCHIIYTHVCLSHIATLYDSLCSQSPASLIVSSHDGDSGTHKSSSPKMTTPTRALTKRLSHSISKMYHHHGNKPVGGRSDAASNSTLVRSSAGGSTDKVSHDQSQDLEREGFPGGDAMLEVLTRLQSYQDSLQMQLDVC